MASLIDKVETHILSKDNFREHNFKYVRIMSMIYITLLLAATVAAYRIVIIGPVPEPGSTLIYTFSFFWANIFAEVYGPNLSKKLIWESIGCGYLFAILITGINLLPAPDYWNNTDAFEQVLGHILRFTNAGVIGFLISAFLNVYLLTKWKFKLHGRLFWLRSLIAASVSEGAATFVTGFITFFGMMPNKHILYVMTSALVFKILYGFVAVWPASFIAFLLKKKEIDVCVNPSINPFRFNEQ